MEFTYRKAIQADVPALNYLGQLSYAQYEAILIPEEWEVLEHNLTDISKTQAIFELSDVIICEQDGAVVGVVYLVPSGNATDLAETNWSYMRMLGVHPEYRGLGVGKELVLRCVALAKANGEAFLGLHTGDFMDPARFIYMKMGFEKIRPIVRLGMKYWIYLLDLNNFNIDV